MCAGLASLRLRWRGSTDLHPARSTLDTSRLVFEVHGGERETRARMSCFTALDAHIIEIKYSPVGHRVHFALSRYHRLGPRSEKEHGQITWLEQLSDI